jgi:hypothetical protein
VPLTNTSTTSKVLPSTVIISTLGTRRGAMLIGNQTTQALFVIQRIGHAKCYLVVIGHAHKQATPGSIGKGHQGLSARASATRGRA